jgi:hypothetical protein
VSHEGWKDELIRKLREENERLRASLATAGKLLEELERKLAPLEEAMKKVEPRIKPPPPYQQGDRVELKHEPGTPDYVPEKTGRILEVKDEQHGWSILVEVDPGFRSSSNDDGLRKITTDQIKQKVIPRV